MSNKAERPAHNPPPLAGASIAIRAADDADREPIAYLAQRDSAVIPGGPLLVAEVGGEIVAALPIGGGRAIADPFRRTADAVELLHSRARQVAGVRPRAPRLLARTPGARLVRPAAPG